ncbi:UDP-N-acetyl-D-galactosamine dehydrogenase [Thermodesulfovibrio aggregans]|uniref:UDP-N-acetyl-D-galactosamine dehydrogenase n=1 Tax=Thermodesulfovibrio aggregans TaxID=86166 RepID=A0A0U9HVP3_9BACT|nr:nucleotide sugar dehydrogenase [Thermodesulfovibrio aggregans]GAQ94961.1 UDP-N-acetyl-D-galactosamine dehydrogenase [Thermodesulfovibrio aggregans]
MLSFDDFLSGKKAICVVGLGYVGLPLALLLSKKFNVIGFDINDRRIKELKKSIDTTGEFLTEELNNSSVQFTSDEKFIKKASLIIVAVPTPVDKIKNPDLSFVKSASHRVGRNLQRDSLVVYESTVWPGLTEEICVPILEKESGLKWKKDFNVGYSPERVNPGDKEHTIDKIVKVVAGDTEQTTDLIAKIYGAVIEAGVYRASNIKTAEAAKVIENIQRDLNIALMNELAIVFHKLGIDTKEVLEAASTKWNFLRFEPGLVGGHCIGVDPYYLTHKAQQVGYTPQVILAGRGINEYIPRFIAEETVKLMIKNDKKVNKGRILILGFTFKENISDVRNTKVYELYKELKEYNIDIHIYDPRANKEEVKAYYGIDLIDDIGRKKFYDALIIAVKHKEFIENFTLPFLKSLCKEPLIVVDIKGILNKKEVEKQGGIYWTL